MPKQLPFSPEEKAKVQANKERREATAVDKEWMFIAEFGRYFGYDGVKAILNNEIDLGTATMLLNGARKSYYSDVIDTGIAQYSALVASKSKTAGSTFKKGMGHYYKNKG